MRNRAWEWRDSLVDFGREMNRLLGNFAPGISAPLRAAVPFPPVNLWHDDDVVYLEAELPGVQHEDLHLAVQNNVLTLSGERRSNLEPEAAYQRRERGVGQFSRTVELPVEVDAGKITAELNAGILTVKLPKAAAAKPRKIPIQLKA